MKRLTPLVMAVVSAFTAHSAAASGLRGSAASMKHQHGVAVALDYTFSKSVSQVRTLVDDGKLVTVQSDSDLALSGVSHPFARPEVKLFIDRLAAQYHDAIGERMVVTSLVRPTSEQPRNASPLSVHPAGMAVDLRVPANASTRQWLEHTLLSLESAGVLDVTRELHPSHFHVALFPDAYRAYVDSLAAAAPKPVAAPRPLPAVVSSVAVAAPHASQVAPTILLVALLGLGAAVVGAASRGSAHAS